MMARMSWFRNLFKRTARDAEGGDIPAGVVPPSRTAAGEDPLTLSTVFRGVQILQTAICGLTVYEVRDGYREPVSNKLILQPDPTRSRDDFIADIVASLVIYGNAYVRLDVFNGQTVACSLLPADLVTVTNRNGDPANPDLRYSYMGRKYNADRIVHMKYLNVPGAVLGMGPLSACRSEIESAQAAKNCKAKYYRDSSNIKAIMTSEKELPPDAAARAKAQWEAQGDVNGTKFIGNGYRLQFPALKAEDLQFIASQKFDTTQIARLLGIPASLMLAAVEGSNLTYSNIEQAWIEFADYTLAAYTNNIEELFNRLLPRGRTAVFDWDSARRTDVSERFNAYKTSLDAGFYTLDEVRAREGLRPLSDEQKQALAMKKEATGIEQSGHVEQ